MIYLLLIEILGCQAKLLKHCVKSSGLELVFEVANDCKLAVKVQSSVTPFASSSDEIHGHTAFSSKLPDATDEL